MNNHVWCCIGSGPSLTREDVEACKDRVRVLAVNDAYRIAPFADAVYAADIEWWAVHWQFARRDFAGRMYTCLNNQDRDNPYGAHQLYDCQVFDQTVGPQVHKGLSREKDTLRMGGLSGYQAINVAYNWGAKVILLLGYDCGSSAGKAHWFGDHPKPLRNTKSYAKYLKNFATIKPADYGIEIINCSRHTAIDAFPRMTIDSALDKYAGAVE